jgi:hypothetical protein
MLLLVDGEHEDALERDDVITEELRHIDRTGQSSDAALQSAESASSLKDLPSGDIARDMCVTNGGTVQYRLDRCAYERLHESTVKVEELRVVDRKALYRRISPPNTAEIETIRAVTDHPTRCWINDIDIETIHFDAVNVSQLTLGSAYKFDDNVLSDDSSVLPQGNATPGEITQ